MLPQTWLGMIQNAIEARYSFSKMENTCKIHQALRVLNKRSRTCIMYHMGFRLLLCVYDVFNSALSDKESVTQNQPLLPLGLCPWEHSPEWHYFIRGQEKFYSSLASCQVGFPKLLGLWLLPICGYSLHTPRLRWGLAWRCFAILLRGGCEDEQVAGLTHLPWLLGFPGCNMVASILLVGWGHR